MRTAVQTTAQIHVTTKIVNIQVNSAHAVNLKRTQQRNNTTDYAVLYVTPSVTQTTPQHFAYYLTSSDIGVPLVCQ